MFKIASVLAIAAAALVLPVAAADKPATDKAAAEKAAPVVPQSQLPTQDQIIERTGNETRVLPPPPKMTPEQKKADKKAKRTGVPPEEQQRQLNRSPG